MDVSWEITSIIHQVKNKITVEYINIQSNMLRIAIICKSLLKGGAEKQALILAKSLVEKNIDLCLINLCHRKIDPEYLRFIKENSIRYYSLSGGHFFKLCKVQRILKKEKTTLILSYLTFANFITGLSKLFNKKIKTIGGIRNELLPKGKFMIEKIIHNYLNDYTIFNNYSARDKFIKKGFLPEKIIVIQNAIEFDAPMTEKIARDNEVIKIVTVGRFVKQKDYETALYTFRNLLDTCKKKDFIYNIVGYGPLEQEIRSLAGKLKIDHKIKILINPIDLNTILKESDIFLSTSLFEGVSNSIMEAMIAGLPVVATDVGDNSYLVKNDHNGYLVPCMQFELIAEKLALLAEDENKRNEFGKNSQLIIENNFTKEKFIEKYLKFFSDVIPDEPHSRV